MTTTESSATGSLLSARIRAASADAHKNAEGAGVIRSLFQEDLDLRRYAEMVTQLRFVYDVIERAGDGAMRANAIAAPFLSEALRRVPALDADRNVLLGHGAPPPQPLPATGAYVERLEEVCFDWPGGFVAHHYVRYMGDLSGGQYIARAVAKAFDVDGERGAAFYAFPGIPDQDAFKQRYRAALDAAPWAPEEQERIIDEVLRAYALNARLMQEL